MEYGIQSSGNPSCPELSSGCPRSRSRTPWGPCRTNVGGRRAAEPHPSVPAGLGMGAGIPHPLLGSAALPHIGSVIYAQGMAAADEKHID